jgi:murein DD-endopeptidase MepM/ murein hydrolase activator NlpD
VRGQQVGTIGTNRGMYPAHLHFEIRKNLFIGYNQRGFGKDYSNYYVPSSFIAQRRKLYGGGRSALVAVNTFNAQARELPLQGEAPPPQHYEARLFSRKTSDPESPGAPPSSSPTKKGDSFRVNRFSDLLSN